MKIHSDIIQGTKEWHALRCGKFTASSVGDLLTAKGAIAANETSRALVNRIARERMSGRSDSERESWDMIRGTEMEPIARSYYEKYHHAVEQVGFITNEINDVPVGCSPDGLVLGFPGMIEIKSRNESVHFKEVLSGEVPAGDMPQIQFQLMVTGREWCDYVSFCDGWPLLVIRVAPNPMMQAILRDAVWAAEVEVARVIQTYKAMSGGFPMTDKIPDADDSQLT